MQYDRTAADDNLRNEMYCCGNISLPLLTRQKKLGYRTGNYVLKPAEEPLTVREGLYSI